MITAQLIAEELLAKEPPHPLLPLPSVDDVMACLSTESGVKVLAEICDYRRSVIASAQADPLRFELEPDFWADARTEIAPKTQALVILGGNRSSKSFFCGKSVVGALVDKPGTQILAVSEDETASILTQQKIIWRFIPKEIKTQCHNRRDPHGIFYMNYSEANGFSERKVVFPRPKHHRGEPSRLIFATYGEEPDDYEGVEWGHPTDWTIQWWADENLRLAWLLMFLRRGKFRPGTGLWSYTPIHGITPTIKEAVGKGAKTIKSVPAKLLPDRVNVPGLPRGHMPYIQQGTQPGIKVFYFHSEMSPFGPGPNGSGKPYAESVAEDCSGKPVDYVKKIAYGYTEDVIGLCYPKFSGNVHVIRPENMPKVGTNYLYFDPAGDRNWFLMWVRVIPGNPRRFYIYREWPDVPRFGEWAQASTKAVTQESRKGWDGDRGPAQRNLGWGVARYKLLMLDEETIRPELTGDGLWKAMDPHRRRVLDLKMAEVEIEPLFEKDGVKFWNDEKVAELKKRHPALIYEKIQKRKSDPRAAMNPAASEKGGTNIIELFAKESKVRTERGEQVAPSMYIEGAYTGKGIDDGVSHVAELLDYNEHEELCPVLNEPRLYVSAECRNLIWMFENYTNQGGEEGGCKDPADVVRYLAQDDDARYIGEGGKLVTSGFKEGF